MNDWKSTLRLTWLKIEDVRIPDVRLRSRLKPDEEEALGASIRTDGVLQPVSVVEDPETHRLWLVDGMHRLNAAKAKGETVVPAIVKAGSLKDAILGSAKYNLHRGRVNVGDLAEYVEYLHEELEMSYDDICRELNIRSKGYISMLVRIAGNREALENLRRGEVTVQEAYNTLPGPKFYDRTSSEIEGLTDEDFHVTVEESTGSLREAMATGKRFEPTKLTRALTDEDLKPKRSKAPRRCDFCGEWIGQKDFAYIIVHKTVCKERAMRAIQEAAMNPQPQPAGEHISAGEAEGGGDEGG